MNNFVYHNPVKIVFGKNTIPEIAALIPGNETVLITYGGGSIMKNGVYDQVKSALKGRHVFEFGGIEPNPKFETLMEAVDLARREKVSFLLAVGGGSVIDGTKFIAGAIPFEPGKEWDILAKREPLKAAVPIGTVLTLPATGSEMNCGAVISRLETEEKRVFVHPLVYPRFSVLDPETTYTLPPRQTANGVVDTFVHVMEQYLTYPVNAPLQDRQAEGILLTLIEEGPKALTEPRNYDVRAAIMWCATQALNDLLGCGVPQDWSTHHIGHEITAFYGLDHAQTLAIVLPAMMSYRRAFKKDKILQYGERIWGVTEGSETARIDTAIAKTKAFFNSLGIKTSLTGYGIEKEGLERIGKRIDDRGVKLGEQQAIGGKEIDAILALCL